VPAAPVLPTAQPALPPAPAQPATAPALPAPAPPPPAPAKVPAKAVSLAQSVAAALRDDAAGGLVSRKVMECIFSPACVCTQLSSWQAAPPAPELAPKKPRMTPAAAWAQQQHAAAAGGGGGDDVDEWVPPTNQPGDGRSSLNEKYGY
jgi:hypothetical protein